MNDAKTFDWSNLIVIRRDIFSESLTAIPRTPALLSYSPSQNNWQKYSKVLRYPKLEVEISRNFQWQDPLQPLGLYFLHLSKSWWTVEISTYQNESGSGNPHFWLLRCLTFVRWLKCRGRSFECLLSVRLVNFNMYHMVFSQKKKSLHFSISFSGTLAETQLFRKKLWNDNEIRLRQRSRNIQNK